MSSILNALKKLEKDRKKTRGDLSGLSPVILYEQDKTVKRIRQLLRGVVIFVCGGAAVYAFLHRTVPQNSRMPVPPPVSTDAGSRSAGGPSLVPASAGSQPPAEAPASTARVLLPSAVRPVSVLPDRGGRSPSGSVQLPVPTAIVSPAVPLHVSEAPADQRKRPELIVHGIAFQEEGRSVAVVNGTPVQTGAVIDGVIVDKINTDRVHFRQGQETFDVLLDKGGR